MPTIKDSDGRLALHWATNNPSAEALALLVARLRHVDVNVVDSSGMTPLMWAAFHR